MRQHGLYKYVCDGEIIYIGKSNSSVDKRIAAHRHESKFHPYLQKSKIYVCDLTNPTETDILERVLINHYKPVLNGTDNFPGLSNMITFKEPDWKPWKPQEPASKKKPLHKVSKKEAEEYLAKNLKFLDTYNYILDKLNNKEYTLRPSLFNDKQTAASVDITDIFYTDAFEMGAVYVTENSSGSVGITGYVETFESEAGNTKAFFRTSRIDNFVPHQYIELIDAANKYYKSVIKQK